MNLPYDVHYFIDRHQELLREAELARRAAGQRRHTDPARPGGRLFRRRR